MMTSYLFLCKIPRLFCFHTHGGVPRYVPPMVYQKADLCFIFHPQCGFFSGKYRLGKRENTHTCNLYPTILQLSTFSEEFL